MTQAEAQEGLSELTRQFGVYHSSTSNIIKYIIVAILAIGASIVIYKFVTKSDNAYKYLLAWLIALLITILFL